MAAPAAPSPNPASPPPASSAVSTAWPRSAQWATAFFLGLATALLTVQTCAYLGAGSRPTRLECASEPAYRIDLNRADRALLLQLPGVGEQLAERIEAYRAEHGGFRSLHELTQVGGIGATTLERLRPWICIGPDFEEVQDEQRPAHSPARRAGKKERRIAAPIDINRATVAELQQLPGIGPKRAQRILDERRQRPFQSVEDLRRVPGIGSRSLERLRPYVRVTAEPALLRVASADQEPAAPGR